MTIQDVLRSVILEAAPKLPDDRVDLLVHKYAATTKFVGALAFRRDERRIEDLIRPLGIGGRNGA